MAKSKWPAVEAKLFEVKMWCRDGLLEKDIAKKLGISVSTLEEYKNKYPQFSEAIKTNKEIADWNVEDSLYKKCVGSYAKEEKAFKCKEVYYDDEGHRCEREVVQVVKVDTFIPPDTFAITVWLNNRKPKNWRKNANKETLDQEKFTHEKEIDEKKYW